MAQICHSTSIVRSIRKIGLVSRIIKKTLHTYFFLCLTNKNDEDAGLRSLEWGHKPPLQKFNDLWLCRFLIMYKIKKYMAHILPQSYWRTKQNVSFNPVIVNDLTILAQKYEVCIQNTIKVWSAFITVHFKIIIIIQKNKLIVVYSIYIFK